MVCGTAFLVSKVTFMTYFSKCGFAIRVYAALLIRHNSETQLMIRNLTTAKMRAQCLYRLKHEHRQLHCYVEPLVTRQKKELTRGLLYVA